MLFKEVRLTALQESPLAFGSTYAKESKLTDADWLARSRQWTGEVAVGFLAMDGDQCVGLLLCAPEDQDRFRAEALSMWVAPTHRHQGAGRMLMEAIIDWCRGASVTSLSLFVVTGNDGAIAFYERLGFAMTGRIAPYANDPAMLEYEMRREFQTD